MLPWAGAGWLTSMASSREDAHALSHDPIGIAKQQRRCLLGWTLPALCASCADAKLDRAYIVTVAASSVGARGRVPACGRTNPPSCAGAARLPQGTTGCRQSDRASLLIARLRH